MQKKPRVLFFLLAILLLAGSFCSAATPIPFKSGEKLLYGVYWEEFPVGEVVFDIRPITTVNSIPAYHFTMRSETSPILDAVLMIADRIESYADTGMTHALLYKEHKNGTMGEDATITFDWQKREAQYCLNGKKFKPSALLPGAFDPLSVLYALRLLDLNGMREIAKPFSNGFQCVIVKAKVLGKQKVRVESGEYNTYVIEPLLAGFPEIFDKISGATVKLWISSDERKLPIKVVCDFPLGRFRAELKSLKTNK
ncbi:MAG: DUF3108 domain-containing protein [Methanosarcinaceae archaeon]|nr:DUF3108 domain-containing protein [Methanosarcinaceae archaeon]